MLRALRLLVLAAALVVVAPASAAPPSKADLKAAKQLATDAQRSLKKGDYGRAVVLLEEAEQKVPSYEFAMPLAKARSEEHNV